MSQAETVKKAVLAVGIIAIILGAGNLALLFQLSGQVSNLAKQVEVVVGNEKVIMQEPHVVSFMAAYKEKGQIVIDAQKEGKLTYYFSQSTEDAVALADLFKKKYPWMQIDFWKGSGWSLNERYETEAKAGKWIADVVQSGISNLGALAGQGYLASYESTAIAKISPDFKHPQNLYCGTRAYAVSMMLNSKLIPRDRWPTDWTDFANPKPEWKGKVSCGDPRIHSNSYAMLSTFIEKYGVDKARAIYRGLKTLDPMVVLVGGSTQVAELIITGERPIAFGMLFDRWVMFGPLGKNAPVEWIVPKSGVVMYTLGASVFKNAPHPNAARLFYDFLFSQEAADFYVSLGFIPLSPGAKLPDYIQKYVMSVKPMTFDEVLAEQKRDERIAMWLQDSGVEA